MKKFISLILSVLLSATAACALCACAAPPSPPQLVLASNAYHEHKIIDDEDVMNIACFAGNGPLRKTANDRYTVFYEPIKYTPTITVTPISDEELQNIAAELFGDVDYVLNDTLIIHFFGEYHGYYALGIYYEYWMAIMERFFTHYYIGDTAWNKEKYIYDHIYIYTTPKKTKVKEK